VEQATNKFYDLDRLAGILKADREREKKMDSTMRELRENKAFFDPYCENKPIKNITVNNWDSTKDYSANNDPFARAVIGGATKVNSKNTMTPARLDRGSGLCGGHSEIKYCEFADEQYMLFTDMMEKLSDKSKVEFERFEIIHYTS
jgi:hypothetical protein